MRIALCAIGRAKRGPEQALTADYMGRLKAMGRGMGFTDAALLELEPRGSLRGDELRRAESALILSKRAPGGRLIALDERGAALSSAAFARQLGRWRDDGAPEAMFAIGGADGHHDDLRAAADAVISFGAMTWPHMLARVMLAEQLYRAVSILGGHPYHRA